MKPETVKSAVIGVAALGVLYVGWKAWTASAGMVGGIGRAASDAMAAAVQAYERTAAEVSSGWNNNIATPFAAGQLYAETGVSTYAPRTDKWSDAAYAGIDPYTGQPVDSGEWYSNPEALRYEYSQPAAAKPAATSTNGAAFGIYPAAFPSSGLSAAAAADARRVFALTDPRLINR